MTIEEANIYLPQEEGLDPIDVYESKLFELKQFLTSHFPISKVVKAKINRITLLNDAYLALGGAFEPVNEESDEYVSFVWEKDRITEIEAK